MPMLPIRQLGRGGVIADTAPQDLQLNQVTEAINVEFTHGDAVKMAGNEQVDLTFEKNGSEQELTWFQPWIFDGSQRLAMMAGADIYYHPGASVMSLATAPFTLSSDNWQSDVFANWAIVNSGLEAPMYSVVQDGSDWAFLPGWVAQFGALAAGAPSVVRSFKNVLFALGVGDDDYTVYWSAPGGPESFPTSWDFADVSTLAGRKPLNARFGKLVDAVPLADSLIVYTQFSAYSVSISNDFKVFNFRRLFQWGLANRDCAAQFENYHFCIGANLIYAHDGSRIQRIADNKIEDKFFAENSDLSKTFVTRDAERHTIIVYYPTGGAEWPNRVMKYNWLEGGIWTFEDLDYPTRCIGPALRPPRSDTWADLANIGNGTWGALAGLTWGDFEKQDQRTGVFMLEQPAGVEGRYVQRSISNDRQGVDFYASIERKFIDLDEAKQTTDNVIYLRKVLPQIGGQGMVRMMFGWSDSLNDQNIRWGKSQLYDLSSDYRLDTRVAGRYLHYRIGSWPGVDGDAVPLSNSWQITGMDLDVEMDGTR